MGTEIDLDEIRRAVDILAYHMSLAYTALASIEDYLGAWPGARDHLSNEEIETLSSAVEQFRKGNLDV